MNNMAAFITVIQSNGSKNMSVFVTKWFVNKYDCQKYGGISDGVLVFRHI